MRAVFGSAVSGVLSSLVLLVIFALSADGADIGKLERRVLLFGGRYLTVLSPGPLVDQKYELTADSEAFVANSEYHTYSSDAIEVTVSWVRYKDKTSDPAGGMQAVIEGLAGQPGVTDFEYTVADTKIAEFPAKRLSASFKNLATDNRMEAVFFGDQADAWAVSCFFSPADEDSAKAAARILESVSIK